MPRGRAPGFTLLEVLVVLALIGLLAGLTAPRLGRMHDSIRVSLERDDVLRRLDGLGYAVYRQGRPATLRAYPFPGDQAETDRPPLALPPGWTLHAPEPIAFYANGACGGGIVQARYKNIQFPILLTRPTCAPRRVATES